MDEPRHAACGHEPVMHHRGAPAIGGGFGPGGHGGFGGPRGFGPGGHGGFGGPRGFGPGGHGGFGGPRGFGPGFGPGGPGGPGGGRGFGGHGRRRRMRRGDVRAALLVLLDEQPMNGYGLMQEIEQRSNGAWRPSPGSVYPALAQLEDEGLVQAEEAEGRKSLTDAGRTYVADNRERLGEPWAQAGQELGEERLGLRGLLWQLGSAAMQVATAGTDAQVAQARSVLATARRDLYRILAEDAGDATAHAGETDPDTGDGGDEGTTPPAA